MFSKKRLNVGFALLAIASVLLSACASASQVAPTAQVIIQTVAPQVVTQVVTQIVAGTSQVVQITTTPAPPAPTAVPAAGPKIHRFSYGPGDVPTIDPALTTDTSSVQVVDETTVGLTRQNEVSTAVEPGMADTWDVSADGKTLTFHLRKDVPWVSYNGATGKVVKVQTCPDKNSKTTDRMVTAHDFEYGIKRTLDPKTASGYAYVLLSTIQGAADFNGGKAKDASKVAVTATDDWTLQVGVVEKAAYNLNILGMWVAHAQPKFLIDGDTCDAFPARADRWTETGFFVGYGPFTLKEWIHDSTLTVIKNPFWPGSASVPQAKIDEVTGVMLDEPPAFAEYEAGNLDTATVPLAETDRVKADATLSKELKIAPVLCTYYYGFNTKAPFVDDARVRLALSESIDRKGLIDNVLKGGQEPAQWMSRPGLAGAPTIADHPDLGVKFDPADAKKQLAAYLAEKNITADKVDISLMFNTSSGHQKIAEAIQQMWKTNLGLDIKLVNQEWKVFLKTIRDPKATPQIWRLGWCQDYPDANNFTREVFSLGSSANPTGGGGVNYNNPDFEKMLIAAAQESDPKKRVEAYAAIENLIVKTDAIIAPIYWYTSVGVTKPYITRTYSVLGGLEHWEKWDMAAH